MNTKDDSIQVGKVNGGRRLSVCVGGGGGGGVGQGVS